MPFSEPLKLKVKRRAHFLCCICKTFGVQVHHIEPEALGGPDTEENAAPLCPTCHDIWGANEVKRKQIREARDLWYDICETRYKSDNLDLMQQMNDRLAQTATKNDLREAIGVVMNELTTRIAPANVSVMQAREAVSSVTSSVVSSIASLPLGTHATVSIGDIFRVTGTADAPAQSTASKPPDSKPDGQG